MKERLGSVNSPDYPDTAGLDEGYQPRFVPEFFFPRYWPIWCLLGFVWLCTYLPREVSGFLGARIGSLFYWLSKKRRRIAQINLELCFPELDAVIRHRLLRRHFRVYGQCMLDIGLAWWVGPAFLERYIHIEGLEHYRDACKRGRNAILLTGHFAAMDVGEPALSRHYPQVGLIKPIHNRLIDYFLQRGRTRFGSRMYLRDRGMRPIIKAIKAGFGFSYLPDEDHGPDKSIFVPFLGTEAATITALGRLVAMTDAVVLPSDVRRVSNRKGYRIVIRPPLEGFPTSDPVADAARMNEELGKIIREIPDQYIWTFKFFRTRPNGEPSPYD